MGLCDENTQTGGGVGPNPLLDVYLPNTQLFLPCQNHFEVLKHVLQKGGEMEKIDVAGVCVCHQFPKHNFNLSPKIVIFW